MSTRRDGSGQISAKRVMMTLTVPMTTRKTTTNMTQTNFVAFTVTRTATRSSTTHISGAGEMVMIETRV